MRGTTSGAPVIIAVRGLQKAYGALRPLRIEHLDVREEERVALLGCDRPSAEVLVDLLTGATLPDRGEIRVFGQLTSAIPDGDAWLASLDRFGILSERAVLLDALTAQQNLAVPFSLDLDPIPPHVQSQVAALAADAGLSPGELQQPVSALPEAARLRVRLARAVALAPAVLLAEHPNALVPAEALSEFAADFVRLASRRRLATLTLTADPRFAASIATRVLQLNAASGQLSEQRAVRRWLSGWAR